MWNIIAAALGTVAGVILGLAILMSGPSPANQVALLGSIAATTCGAAWLAAAIKGQ
jgi:hypothetical protein